MTKNEREQFGKICKMAYDHMMHYAIRLGCKDTEVGKANNAAYEKIRELVDALADMQHIEQEKTSGDRIQDAIFIMDEICGREPRITAKRAIRSSIDNLAKKADIYY